EDADVDLAGLLHRTGDGHTSGLDLPGGDVSGLERLQAEITEADLVATLGSATGAALLLLSVFCSFWREHGDTPARLAILLRVRLVAASRQDLAVEDPALDADGAVRGPRLGEAVVDVRAQGVQRHATLAIPLAARH